MKKIFLTAMLLVGLGITHQSTAQDTIKNKKLNVAILLFDGVQIIDYTGPYEVLGGAPAMGANTPVRPFNVYTVSEKPTITTAMRMSVNSTYTFSNAPNTDILIVPGGGGSLPGQAGVAVQMNNPVAIKWVQQSAANAKLVMSVCNGAFILAQAGLLDNLEATTTNGFYELLEKKFPAIKKVYRDKRFVDNGKIITTAGLSSGIDGSLHICEKFFGRAYATSVAMGIEYNWDPESNYARGKIADTKLPPTIYSEFYFSNTELIKAEGGVDKWEEAYSTPAPITAAQMLKQIDDKWIKEKGWTKIEQSSNSATLKSSWKLADAEGQSWISTVTIQPGNENGKLIIDLQIQRML